MSAKNLAQTGGFAVEKTTNGLWKPGTPSWTKTSTSKTKASGDTILVTTLVWTMTGCTFASNSFGTGGGSMNATASKCKCEGKFPLREDDQGSCSGSFTSPPPASSTIPCSCTFKINNAGQTKAKGV